MSVLSQLLKKVGIPEINLSGIARLTGMEDKAAREVVKKLKLSPGDLRRLSDIFLSIAVEQEAKG